jgi:hypothetical protein
MNNKEYEKLLALRNQEIALLKEINKMLEIQVDYWRIMAQSCKKHIPWIPFEPYEDHPGWHGASPYIPHYDPDSTAKPPDYNMTRVTCNNQE